MHYLGSHKKEREWPTATGGKMKLEQVAKACGIESAWAVQEVAAFREQVQMALANGRAALYSRTG